jgi:hypothetical protein
MGVCPSPSSILPRQTIPSLSHPTLHIATRSSITRPPPEHPLLTRVRDMPSSPAPRLAGGPVQPLVPYRAGGGSSHRSGSRKFPKMGKMTSQMWPQRNG